MAPPSVSLEQDHKRPLSQEIEEWHPAMSRRGANPSAWIQKSRQVGPKVKSLEIRSAAPPLAATFQRCAEDWREATMFSSSVLDIVMHPAYQRIIGLGPRALPHILRELKETTDHWFWALRAITGIDAAEGTTTLQDAARAWLAWGHHRGLI